MSAPYFVDQIFEKQDFTAQPLLKGEYESCRFENCRFQESDLKQIRFTDCVFKDCNLSMAKLAGVTFRDVVFKDCKLMGLHFDVCNDLLFSVSFTRCMADLCSFYLRKMKKTRFENCSLKEVDFSEADLSHSVFADCNLENAVFENTQLEKADLRSAFNYRIDPEKNYLKKARFSVQGLAGLLEKYDLSVEN
jgi:uncharacterized protein YjbI with pentapeptide repeats